MKPAACAIILLISAWRVDGQAEDDRAFEAALAKVEAAQVEFARGRPDAFKALWSHGDDVTLTGGLGGAIEKGWPAVSRRLDWASSQYSDGQRSYQEVSRYVGVDLAYIVQIETIRFRAPGQIGETTLTLRATMVFRRELSGWQIVHRHADSANARQTTGK